MTARWGQPEERHAVLSGGRATLVIVLVFLAAALVAGMAG